MKSLFARNFLIYALVIVLGFTVLGSSFIYQVNRFSLEETQTQLAEAAEQAVLSTQAYCQHIQCKLSRGPEYAGKRLPRYCFCGR